MNIMFVGFPWQKRNYVSCIILVRYSEMRSSETNGVFVLFSTSLFSKQMLLHLFYITLQTYTEQMEE